MTLQNPKTAKEFTSGWAIPNDLNTLISGDSDLSDMYTRQNHLIGKTLDACIVLYIYERINNKASYNSLKSVLPKNFSAEEFSKLAKADDDEKLRILLEMIQKRSIGHRTLITDKPWNNYKSEFENYLLMFESWQKKVKCNTTYHGEGRIPPRPFMPIDPRIKAINDDIGEIIQLVSSGSKIQSAIEKKATREQVEYDKIKDINRVTVLPTTPQYAEDFVKIMNLLNPPKRINNYEIPRFFEEQPEVFNNGYYCQKLLIALDKDSANSSRNNNKATIAEIKITSARMEDAGKLSAVIKTLIDETRPDIIKPNESHGKTLQAAYMIAKEDFESIARTLATKQSKPSKQLYLDYINKFPVLDNSKLDDPKTYSHLVNELVNLSREINMNAIINDPDWQKKYLRTAILQQLSNNKDDRIKINAKLPTELPRNSSIHNLQSIADAGHFNLTMLTRDIKDEFELTKSSSPQK